MTGIIAALDYLADKISNPWTDDINDPRKYYNRKGFFAISVQAAVSADYRFLYVSSKHAGSTQEPTAL